MTISVPYHTSPTQVFETIDGGWWWVHSQRRRSPTVLEYYTVNLLLVVPCRVWQICFRHKFPKFIPVGDTSWACITQIRGAWSPAILHLWVEKIMDLEPFVFFWIMLGLESQSFAWIDSVRCSYAVIHPKIHVCNAVTRQSTLVCNTSINFTIDNI